MIETINRKEFIAMLAEEHNLHYTEARDLYEKFVSTHEKAVKTGKRVLVGDLYRVQAVVRKGGLRRNPRTLEKVESPDSVRIKVIVGTAFKKELEADLLK